MLRLTFRALLALAALTVALVGVAPGSASRPLYDANVTFLSLKANAKGEALVKYRRSDGKVRNVLVWGALNAVHPTPGGSQVQFKFDYAGGWGKVPGRQVLVSVQEPLYGL